MLTNNYKIVTIILGITNLLVLLIILDRIILHDERPFILPLLWIICIIINVFYFRKIKKKGTLISRHILK